MPVPVEHALVVSAILFAIGVAGVIARRNLLVMFMGVELMLNGAGLAFVAFAYRHGAMQPPAVALQTASLGHGTAFLGAAVAAAEAAVGLAVILLVYRGRREVDADRIDLMRG